MGDPRGQRAKAVLVCVSLALFVGGLVALAVRTGNQAPRGQSDGGLAGGSASAPAGTAIAFKACSPGTVLTTLQRTTAGLVTWPDGTFGVVRSGAGDLFVASDGRFGDALTAGTAGDPLAFGLVSDPPVAGLRTVADYAAGGPVYRDPASGRWLLFYHAERWPGGDSTRYYSWIGMAESADQGRSWRDLGEIISPQRGFDPAAREPVEVGGAPFVVNRGFFYVYLRDPLTAGGEKAGSRRGQAATVQLGVARAPVSRVLAAAATGRRVAWREFSGGSWTQPALGGVAGPLEPGNPATRWFDVGFDAAAARYVLVVAANDAEGVNLYIAFSRDGLRWSARRRLTADRAEDFYPTLVGTGEDPQQLGDAFYLYYTSSRTPGSARWSDAVLSRMTVRLGTGSGGC